MKKQRALDSMRPESLPRYVRRNQRGTKETQERTEVEVQKGGNKESSEANDKMSREKEIEKQRALDLMRPESLPRYVRRNQRGKKETQERTEIERGQFQSNKENSEANDIMSREKEIKKQRALDSMRPESLPHYVRRNKRNDDNEILQDIPEAGVIASSPLICGGISHQEESAHRQDATSKTQPSGHASVAPGAYRVRGPDWNGRDEDDDQTYLPRAQSEMQTEEVNNTNQNQSHLPPEMRTANQPNEVDQSHLSAEFHIATQSDELHLMSEQQTTTKKVTQRKIWIAVGVIVLIGAAIGLGFGLSGSSGGEYKSRSAEEDTSEVQKCQYADVEKITQMREICLCDESIELLPENYITKYNDLKDALFANNVNSLFNYSISSCEVPNLALHWLAEDSLKRESETNDTLVERYALVTCFLSLTNNDPNYRWKNQTGWMSSDSVCDWFGITCNDRQEVTRVNLRNNTLVGEIPAEISLLESLHSVWLLKNKISGSIPTEIGLLTNLVRFDLSNNRFSGTLPTEISLLKSLVYVWLLKNKISGSIPTEIGLLTNLVRFYLADNRFTGTLPTEIGYLTKMEHLYLYRNMIQGKLPTEIGSLQRLVFFDISRNRDISGSIPSELGNCQKLVNLYFASNKLSGTVPSELGDLSNLKFFDFYGTKLTGTISNEICSLLDGNLEVIRGNQEDSSNPVTCDCCTGKSYCNSKRCG